ncbi:MAG: DUF4968 domain-containing protein [Lachnospiraceae bacterium]|nr:DUF4968 domain-containing protein [Lachnospiraceae bacterium]
MEICGKLISLEETAEGWLAHLDHGRMRIVFMTDRILRLRVSFDETEVPDASYVLQTTAWEDRLDPLFGEERTRLTPQRAEREDAGEEILLKTRALTLAVRPDPLNIRLLDADGAVLYEALRGNPFVRDANSRIVHYSRMEEDDCFYGFGEKDGPLDKNKEFVRERATDSWAYDPEKCDTMYKHIPFYIRLRRRDARAIGLFYNNFYESVFNLGREKSNYWPRYTYWQADGGDIDLFLFAGPSIRSIMDDYTLLTGRPVLLPKRALGYQGSSMYYSELEKDSDQALLTFIDTVRKKGFPIDGFHLSSGYTTQENSGRCVFTWNYTRFPHPERFFAAMNERGAQAVPNVKPGVLCSHPQFAEFEEQGVFVRDSTDGAKPAIGPWWGGPGAFWDFTNPKARELWKKLLTETVIAVGTASVWDDNCEYDSLLDHEAVCVVDGAGGTIGEYKPVMSTIMSRLACEAVREHDEEARPYVVCRSGSSGIQKYAQNWVGDNYTSWRTLRHNLPTILGMGLSGQPNDGADIGGFAGPAPDEELFVRWVQHGIFQPRFSIHSANSDNTVTEPWMYHRQTDRIREAILLRYRLLPHFYSLEREAHESGAPIMRPLVFEFQQDAAVYGLDDEFLLGRDLLVANVLEEGTDTRQVYLPAGTDWYAPEEDFVCYAGGQTIEVPVTLDSIPRFVREGTILPMAGNRIYSMEKDPVRDLDLLLVPPAEGATAEYALYDDDGVSNAFEQGVYRRTLIRMEGGDVVRVSFTGEGDYTDTVEHVHVTLIRRDRSPFFVVFDGERLPHFLDREQFDGAASGWYYSETKRAVEIRYPNPKHDATLQVSFEEFDLIGIRGTK